MAKTNESYFDIFNWNFIIKYTVVFNLVVFIIAILSFSLIKLRTRVSALKEEELKKQENTESNVNLSNNVDKNKQD